MDKITRAEANIVAHAFNFCLTRFPAMFDDIFYKRQFNLSPYIAQNDNFILKQAIQLPVDNEEQLTIRNHIVEHLLGSKYVQKQISNSPTQIIQLAQDSNIPDELLQIIRSKVKEQTTEQISDPIHDKSPIASPGTRSTRKTHLGTEPGKPSAESANYKSAANRNFPKQKTPGQTRTIRHGSPRSRIGKPCAPGKPLTHLYNSSKKPPLERPQTNYKACRLKRT